MVDIFSTAIFFFYSHFRSQQPLSKLFYCHLFLFLLPVAVAHKIFSTATQKVAVDNKNFATASGSRKSFYISTASGSRKIYAVYCHLKIFSLPLSLKLGTRVGNQRQEQVLGKRVRDQDKAPRVSDQTFYIPEISTSH